MKKIKLLDALISLFSLQNFAVISKRMLFDNGSTLKKLRKIASKTDLSIINSNSGQKDFINYITSRHMRKTILPSNVKNVLTQPDMNVVNIKYIMHVILYKLKKSKQLFYTSFSMRTSNFHTKSFHLGNMISNEYKSETIPKEDNAELWGGTEAFKLIKFIKDDLDGFINSNPFVLVFFYAYWCHHCLRLKIPFGKVALMAKQANLEMVFVAFDVTSNPELADEMGVVGIPTIKYYNNGKLIAMYKGKRTVEDLFEFVKNPPKPGEQKQPDI